MSTKQGLVYVFTGPGKGKTSAALGVAMRSLGANLKVGWIAWYKQASWGISEFNLPEMLPTKNLQMHALGAGFHINQPSTIKQSGVKTIKIATINDDHKVIDTGSDIEHRQAAEAALEKAHTIISTVNVLILDEINNAIDDNLLTVEQVIELIKLRGATHVILTGRNAHSQISKHADLVTTMQNTKHPFDQGKLAVKGLDY